MTKVWMYLLTVLLAVSPFSFANADAEHVYEAWSKGDLVQRVVVNRQDLSCNDWQVLRESPYVWLDRKLPENSQLRLRINDDGRYFVKVGLWPVSGKLSEDRMLSVSAANHQTFLFKKIDGTAHWCVLKPGKYFDIDNEPGFELENNGQT